MRAHDLLVVFIEPDRRILVAQAANYALGGAPVIDQNSLSGDDRLFLRLGSSAAQRSVLRARRDIFLFQLAAINAIRPDRHDRLILLRLPFLEFHKHARIPVRRKGLSDPFRKTGFVYLLAFERNLRAGL